MHKVGDIVRIHKSEYREMFCPRCLYSDLEVIFITEKKEYILKSLEYDEGLLAKEEEIIKENLL